MNMNNLLKGADAQFNQSMTKREMDDFQFIKNLTYKDLQDCYDRSALGQAVVDRFSEGVFQTNPQIIDGDNEDDVHDLTQFEEAFNTLEHETGLWSTLKTAYSKNRIGNFSTLYLVFDDGIDPSLPVKKGSNLVKIQTFNQIELKPYKLVDDKSSPRYGEVEQYIFNDQSEGLFDNSIIEAVKNSQEVHYSRVVLIAEGADPSDYNGTSAIARAYNGIKTYDRILGASGRGFLNAARGAVKVSSPVGTEFDPNKLARAMGVETDELRDALEQQFEDFHTGFDKMLLTGNLQVEEFNFNLPNPEEFAQIALNSVAASCSCPAEMLIGSQLSQKSSDGNTNNFNKVLMSIRVNFINTVINDIISRLIEVGSIPEPSSGQFRIYWDDLMASSDDDKMNLATKMAAINKQMVDAGQEAPFTADEIRDMTGFDPINDIDLSQD